MTTASTARTAPVDDASSGHSFRYLPRSSVRPLLRLAPAGTRAAPAVLVEAAAARADILAELVDALDDPHKGVRMRAAEAVERVARARHRALEPLAGRLRALFMRHEDPAVQAALAAVVSLRRWPDGEIEAIAERLLALRQVRGTAVRNAALEALWRLSRRSAAVAAVYAAEWDKASRGTAGEKAKARALARAAMAPPVGRRATDPVVQVSRGQPSGQAEITTKA
ncbi:hypothetical protein [Chthonobacter rhizosphaerae]|uniref:hypothetical protein n=1 Tax=Chthonobacter rhizosphaerae TaxID=2735553 RepID=UPI0015EF51E6|nr:hypothetical protein [Chthonobacter rhizosphaerae]